jgi:O-antigen/teichoic acid export membrane protein
MTSSDTASERSPAGGGLPSLTRRLVHGAGWAFLGRAVALPAGLVLTMVLARILPPADLGTYFLAISLVGFLVIPVQLGMGRAMVRTVALALATDRPRAARHAVRVALTVTLIGGGIAWLALVEAPGRWLTSLLASGRDLQAILPLVAPLVLAFALIDLLAEVFRGFHDIRAASVFTDQLIQRLLLASTLALLWFLAVPLQLDAVLGLALGAASAALLLGGLLLARRLGRLADQGHPWTALTIVRQGIPFVLIRLNFWLLTGADVWLLGMFRPSAEVAIYGAASRIALLVGIPLVIINAALAPTIADLHSRGQLARLERVLRTSASVSALPAAAIALLLVVVGEPLLEILLTEAYRDGYPIVLLLAAGQTINVCCGSCTIALTMTGHQRDVVIVSGVTGAVSIAAFALLAPPLGALGVALVAATALALYNATLAVVVRRRLGIATWATLSWPPLHQLLLKLRGTLGG